MDVTPIYAALLALLFVFLSLRTIRLRRRHRVALGDGDNPELRRAMRAHANFAEYVPFALLLVYFVERDGAHLALVHALGLALLAGRLLHAWGVSQPREDFRFRVTGMVLSFGVLLTAALLLLLPRLF
ncbi:MAG: glutathione metabolism protein [Betaproteobacteria bacterium]|nr:glutathione metabolism protein [Betaproteobacteria bacterium]